MDICLLRAFSTPSTWPTSVLSVSMTTMFGSLLVLRIHVGAAAALDDALDLRRLRRGCSGCETQEQHQYDVGHSE